MKDAFEQAFEGDYEKVVIIGSDCAQLQSRHIENAFEGLNKNEIVIGPARDGGYYLLGMKRSAGRQTSFLPHIFDNKPWGRSGVLQQTITDCDKFGLHYKLLEKLNDVDTKKDWEAVKDKF